MPPFLRGTEVFPIHGSLEWLSEAKKKENEIFSTSATSPPPLLLFFWMNTQTAKEKKWNEEMNEINMFPVLQLLPLLLVTWVVPLTRRRARKKNKTWRKRDDEMRGNEVNLVFPLFASTWIRLLFFLRWSTCHPTALQNVKNKQGKYCIFIITIRRERGAPFSCKK